jgi:putative hydrolase of the HAD superfamily
VTAPVRAPVRACLVDVYDTILKSVFTERVLALGAPLGVDAADWLSEFEKTRDDRDLGRLSTAAAFDRALRSCGIEPANSLVADLMRRDMEFSYTHTRLYDDTVPFLAWLRASGVPIALVSNCADSTRGLLEHLGVIPLVDAVVLSCEVGSMKPSPQIYLSALAELGVAAADAVFIDDQSRFCLGAESVGVRPIQITRDGLVDATGGATGGAGRDIPVVQSLLDVKSLL